MVRSLPFGLEPGLRETPLDYVSRLACRNHRDGVRLLCSDFGIRFAAVAAGDGEVLAAVARLGRTNPATLAAEAISPLPRRRLLWRGHELPAMLVSRQRARLCPACALGDVADGSGREEARPWRRGEWLLRDVHACSVHGLGLVELGAQRDPRAPDFSTTLRLARGPSALADRAQPLLPTGLELYVLVRVGALTASESPSPFLDALPLHACLRLSEVVGAVAIDGPGASMTGMSAPALRERQREGFEIVRGGEGPLREFLERLLSAFGRRGGKPGPQALFGRLYLWLAHPALDPSLGAVRDIVRDFAFDRLAIGPGDAVAPFGHRLRERRLHSIRSASVEYGIHPATLRNLLVADGAVAPGPPSASDDLTTFDARLHSGRLAEFAGALDLVAAAAHLGLSTGLLEALVRDGLVVPFFGGAGSAFRHYRFRRADLDAFVASLSAGLSASGSTSLQQILPAARAASCPVTDVVRLLRERRLVRVARADGIGIGTVLVDPHEIRTCRSRPLADMVHPAEVRERTGLPLHVVRALVRHGALPGARHANPATGVLRLMVERADFDRFSADHVSLSELARERKVSQRLLWNRLCERGVTPALDHRLVGAVVFRRDSLPGIDRLDLQARPAGSRRP